MYNPLISDYIGKPIEFRKTKEKGIIIEFEYIPDLNHYAFKIRTSDKIIITFDETEFLFIE